MKTTSTFLAAVLAFAALASGLQGQVFQGSSLKNSIRNLGGQLKQAVPKVEIDLKDALKDNLQKVVPGVGGQLVAPLKPQLPPNGPTLVKPPVAPVNPGIVGPGVIVPPVGGGNVQPLPPVNPGQLVAPQPLDLGSVNLAITPAIVQNCSLFPTLGIRGRMIAGYGMQIVEVRYGSLAYRYGLEVGDIIVRINGRLITCTQQWDAAMYEAGRIGYADLLVDNIRARFGAPRFVPVLVRFNSYPTYPTYTTGHYVDR